MVARAKYLKPHLNFEKHMKQRISLKDQENHFRAPRYIKRFSAGDAPVVGQYTDSTTGIHKVIMDMTSNGHTHGFRKPFAP